MRHGLLLWQALPRRCGRGGWCPVSSSGRTTCIAEDGRRRDPRGDGLRPGRRAPRRDRRGLNVNMEEDDFPPDLRGTATSLRICAGRVFRRVDVLARLLDAFGKRYAEFIAGGFASLRDGWDAGTSSGGGASSFGGRAGRVGNRERARHGRGAPFPPDGGSAIESVHSGEILDFRR